MPSPTDLLESSNWTSKWAGGHGRRGLPIHSFFGLVTASVLSLIAASMGFSLVVVFCLLFLGSTDSRACESVVVARAQAQ